MSGWNRQKTLFMNAIDQPPELRREYVEASGEDQQTIDAVLLLLEDDASGNSIQSPWRPADRLMPGAHVGKYMIESFIGQGGAGTVYRCHREGDSDRQVAVKVLERSGARGISAAALREQRLLSRLHHPYIAHIVDAGLADGHAYIAMELVDGVDLATYCHEHKLTLNETLHLFGQVCDAVEHAHRNLVLHRDIKPENVLVTQDGTPKLLDFGIARLMDAQHAEVQPSTITQAGWMAMTPEYASPEQLRGDSLTTASDVYSLGVMLFQLLTLSKPYRVTDRRPLAVLEELEKNGVPLASVRVKECPTARYSSRDLHGDLELIVAQAMHPDARRRYATPAELAIDLQRFAEKRPITARKDSLWYRLSRLYARQQWAVTAVSIALVAALVAGGVAWKQTAARLDAGRKADSIAQFMFSLFDNVTPSAQQGETFTIEQLLDLGRERAAVELLDDPIVQHRVLQQLAKTQLDWGDVDGAEETHRVIADLASGLSDGNVIVLDARVLNGRLLLSRDKADEALAEFEDVHEELQRNHSADRARLMAAKVHIVEAMIALEDTSNADKLIAEALSIARSTPAMDERDVLRVQSGVLFQRGNIERALEVQLMIVELAESWDRGIQTDALADDLQLVGLLYIRMGQPEPGIIFHRRASEIVARLYGEEHISYAHSLFHIAASLPLLERYEEALDYNTKAVALFERLAPNDERHMALLGVRSTSLQGLGRYEEAVLATEAAYQKVVSVRGPDDWSAITTQLILADQYNLVGRYDDSIRVATEARSRLQVLEGARNQRLDRLMAVRLGGIVAQNLVTLGEYDRAADMIGQLRQELGNFDEGDMLASSTSHALLLWEGILEEKRGNIDRGDMLLTEASRLTERIPWSMIEDIIESATTVRGTPVPFTKVD